MEVNKIGDIMKQLFKIQYILILLLILSQSSCEDSFDYNHVSGDDGQYDGTAWDYINNAAPVDSLTLMKEAISLTGLQNIYSGSEQRTFVVPRNKAFRAYLKANNYASLAAIPVDNLRNTLKYHIAKGVYCTQDPQFMAKDTPIQYDTEALYPIFFSHNTNFQTQINFGSKKVYTVYISNIQPTNGVIHITSDVIGYIP